MLIKLSSPCWQTSRSRTQARARKKKNNNTKPSADEPAGEKHTHPHNKTGTQALLLFFASLFLRTSDITPSLIYTIKAPLDSVLPRCSSITRLALIKICFFFLLLVCLFSPSRIWWWQFPSRGCLPPLLSLFSLMKSSAATLKAITVIWEKIFICQKLSRRGVEFD